MRNFVFLLALLTLFSCAVPVQVVETPDTAPVSTHITRSGSDLIIDMIIPEKEWAYSSHLSDDGRTYTLVVRDLERKMGDFDYYHPIEHIDVATYPSGFKLVFHLTTRYKMTDARSEMGLRVTLTALEADRELTAMETFGGWASPSIPAASFQGAEDQNGTAVISFDADPVYASGEAGGRFYLDIFGVSILPGIVKYKGLLAVNRLEGKTRFIFDSRPALCPGEKSLAIGRNCTGYSGLSGFTREKNDTTESFLFSLPGKPEMAVREMDGMVAFGFKNTRLFSGLFKRYADGDVYKVEAREKDGMLWLVFIHNEGLKYRKYYSGDKFFVVFYRGQS